MTGATDPIAGPESPPGRIVASSRSSIDPFIVMDIMRAAHQREAAGEDIVHMEVGQPGTPAPKLAREAAKRAIDGELLGYTDAMGVPRLRARIAQHYMDWYGVGVDPARIAVTTGSSAAFVIAFLALFDAGSTVGLPSPGYPCYRHILTSLGIKPAILECDEASRWMPTLAMVRADAGLDGLLLASPANPTGTALKREQLAGLVKACREAGVVFISDEIYHGLTYREPVETALAFDDQVVVINSFSKYFSMTGWRIGWIVVPDVLVRPVERLMQNLYISAPSVSQIAACAAFDATEELEGHKQVYAGNRERLLEALPRLGFERIMPPDGAFYIYADVGHLTANSRELADRLLAEAGIATTPGTDFDADRGHRYLRLSYARQEADIVEGIARLEAWLVRQT